MKSLFEFLSFADPNIRYVVAGSILLTASSAIVGSFTFLNKKSLIGDAIAHAVRFAHSRSSALFISMLFASSGKTEA